jgi:hypothetical protein
MHDSELEERLRTVLRDEGDRLPFTVEISRVEAGSAARERSSRNLRLGLLAAGIGIVAFGLAGIGLIRQPIQSGVGATPSPQAGTPFALEMLSAPLGEVMVDRATANPVATGIEGGLVSHSVGSVSPALQHHIAAICLGEGELTLSFGQPDSPDHVYTTAIPCDGEPHDEGLTSDFGGSREVVVQVNGNAAWRVIITGQGADSGVVLPAQLEAWALGGDGQPRGPSVVAQDACGYWVIPEGNDRCDQSGMPPEVGDTPVVIEAGEDLLLQLRPGRPMASVEVSAASPVMRNLDPWLPVLSATPGGDTVRVPLDLDPGVWFVRIRLVGRDSDQEFFVETYLELDVRS